MRRLDLLAAVVVIALAGWAVVAQLGQRPAPTVPEVPPLAIGEGVPPDVVLQDVDGKPQRLGDLFGRTATVLYSWSTTCPCIPWCEDKMHEVQALYGPEVGVSWVAIAGEPTDTPEGVRTTMNQLGATYDLLLDPSHRLCRRMGFDRAAILAVLDGDGYLRFRGNLSNSLKDPTRWYLVEVLEDMVVGQRPRIEETPLTYGCEFSEPIVCDDEESLPLPKASEP